MGKQKLIAAEAMGKAVRFDPQFTMPQKPSFARELMTVPMIDGLLVNGTGDQQVLRGKAALTFIPRLLPLLDGTRTLEDLDREMPDVPQKVLENAVALLYTRGLLADSAWDPADFDPATVDPEIQAFFRRYVDLTRVNRSSREALDRLAHAHVGIYASSANGELIRDHLHKAGISDVRLMDWDTEPEIVPEQANEKVLMIVLVEGEEDQAALQKLDDACARQKIPWLRVAVHPDAHVADLGPYFERGETACYRCFARTTLPYVAADAPYQYDRQLEARLWANMLVVETIYLLSRIAPLATGLHVTRCNLDSWSTQRLRLPKLPGCPNCRAAKNTLGMIEPAVVYEDAVSFPSRHLLDPKDHQVHYRTSNLELAHEGKRYPGASKIFLPERTQLIRAESTTLDALPGRATPSDAPSQVLDMRRLATLLILSAGVKYDDGDKGHKLQRWAPTGGNLGSVELYLIARKVAGLTAGFYFYQASDHALACLQDSDSDEIDQFTRQALAWESSAELPDALILLTAAHHRVTHKYGAFAYRIVNLDAGVALAQMHMAASYLGLGHRTIPRWADDLITDRLDLEEMKEAVTGAFAIHGSAYQPAQEEEN